VQEPAGQRGRAVRVSAPARPAGSLPTISNQVVRLSRDFYTSAIHSRLHFGLPASTLTRPISTMHTAKTQSVRQPQRNRFLLRPIAYYRHYGPAAWIDPVVLRAITISWNNIVIPVRSCLYHGHPDDRPLPWFTNDFGLLRMGCDAKRSQVTHQGRSESERYGHYPHALASLPHTA
jgi:hypothetical protein